MKKLFWTCLAIKIIKDYIELLKIEKSYIFLYEKDYENSLKILKKVKENNLDNRNLKIRYYRNLHITYLGLNNYTLGESYFDKSYPYKHKSNDYYLDKLRYAVGNRNIEKADLYYSKIITYSEKSTSSKIVSDYFDLKKDLYKTNELLKLTLNLKESETVKKISGRLKVFEFFSDFSKELAEMKILNKLKDQQIIDNKLFYIKVGAAILLIIILILAFVEWAARKKRYLDNLTQKSKRTILEAKGQFLENMSHEIRTPITSILGYLSLLKEENLISDKRLNYTNSAIDNTKKMMDSLDNFLNLTSLERSSKFKNVNTSINIARFYPRYKNNFYCQFRNKEN